MDANPTWKNSERNMAIIGWRAYFVSGAIYTSKSNAITDIPNDGMLGLVTFHSDGTKRRITGGDYYYLDFAANKQGMDRGDIGIVALKYPGSILIRGMWTDEETQRACEARMKSDIAP